MRNLLLPFLTVCLFLVIVAIPEIGYAQPGNPAGGTDPDAPITGIEILIALGSMFGVKKIFDGRKNKK